MTNADLKPGMLAEDKNYGRTCAVVAVRGKSALVKLAARVLSQRDPPVALVVVWPVGKTWHRKVVKP